MILYQILNSDKWIIMWYEAHRGRVPFRWYDAQRVQSRCTDSAAAAEQFRQNCILNSEFRIPLPCRLRGSGNVSDDLIRQFFFMKNE